MVSGQECFTDMEQLKNSNELYKSLFELSVDPIGVTTRDGIIVDVNRAWLELFGYTHGEAVGQRVQQMWWTEEDRALWLAEVDQNGFVRNREIRCRNKAGSMLICLISSTVWFNPNGDIIGYHSITRDVTELKRTEQRMKRKSEFIDSVLKAIPDDIVVIDAERKITWSNVEDSAPVGSLLCNSMHGHKVSRPAQCVDESGDPDCPIEYVFRTGETVSFESNSGGRSYWHVVTPCNYNGHISTVMELRRDITEEKQRAERVDIQELKGIAREVVEGYRGVYTAIAELVQKPKGE